MKQLEIGETFFSSLIRIFWVWLPLVNASTSWKSKLPQWNTGRVYMINYSKFMAGRYGPVCNGNRNSKLGLKFAELVCKDNGFRELDFFGSRELYLDFIIENYSNETGKYFETLYPEDVTCLPDFTISGADCPETANKLDDCAIVDYGINGGNCVQKHSTEFIHCSGYYNSDGLTLGTMFEKGFNACRECTDLKLSSKMNMCFARKNRRQFAERYDDNVLCVDKNGQIEKWLELTRCGECSGSTPYTYSNYYYDLDGSDSDYVSGSESSYSEIYSDNYDRKRRSTEDICDLVEVEHNPRKYCPDEWSEGMKKYCSGKAQPITATISIAIVAFFGCAILIALGFCIRCYMQSRTLAKSTTSTHQTEKEKDSEDKISTIKRPLLNSETQKNIP